MVLKKCPVCGFKVKAERKSLQNGQHGHVLKAHRTPAGTACSGSGHECEKTKDKRSEDSDFDIL